MRRTAPQGVGTNHAVAPAALHHFVSVPTAMIKAIQFAWAYSDNVRSKYLGILGCIFFVRRARMTPRVPLISLVLIIVPASTFAQYMKGPAIELRAY